MPVYEYACSKCGHEFEVEQRITDAPTKTCPKCRARKVKRLISMTSFVLKGSGWYSDLYSSSGKDKAKDDAGSKEAKESAAESGGAPAASAAAAESTSAKKEPAKGKKGKSRKSPKAAA
jgi:putative FmdB family regulatory protein